MNTVDKILFVICVVISALWAIVYLSGAAEAKNYQQVICDNEPDPDQCQKIHFWYLSARSNSRTSCCGIADAYWADQVDKVTEQGVYVTITDRRDCQYEGIAPKVEEDGEGNYSTVYDANPCIAGRKLRDGEPWFIPNATLDQRGQGNPTGHVIIYISPSAEQNLNGWGVICFFPGGGA